MATVLYLTLSLLAGAGFYLASHQRLWPGAGRRAPWLRIAASLASALALVSAVAALGVAAGVFAALTALMLTLVLLPYADAWRQAWAAGEEKKHYGNFGQATVKWLYFVLGLAGAFLF